MMINEDKKETGVPNVPFKATFKITTSSLKEILNQLKLIDDRIIIKVEDNAVIFSSRNEEGFESSVLLRYPEHIELMAIAVEEPSTASYNLKSILNIVKELSGNSGVATIQLGTNLPLKIDFELIENERFIYYLAPRAE
jgi:DNA polymerase III sliding clamp (beta) subunit (PCNA family)